MNEQNDTPSADNLFHSHHYAEVANTASLGSTSAESFEKRLEIDNSRQTVSGYHVSLLAQGVRRDEMYKRPVADPRKSQYNQRPSSMGRYKNSGQQTNNRTAPGRSERSGFSEPPARGYNPYQ